jgi:hypothetical protein
METPATKTCPMCAMQIPAKARRCPHCVYWQTRSGRFWRHPITLILAGVAGVFAYAAIMSAIMPDMSGRQPYPPYSGQIEILDSCLVFGEGHRGPTVGVLGTLRNTSPVWWENVHFHVEFRDAEGKLVDAAQTEQYIGNYSVPSGATLAFEASFERKYPQTQYAKHSVKIVSAKDSRSRW